MGSHSDAFISDNLRVLSLRMQGKHTNGWYEEVFAGGQIDREDFGFGKEILGSLAAMRKVSCVCVVCVLSACALGVYNSIVCMYVSTTLRMTTCMHSRTRV